MRSTWSSACRGGSEQLWQEPEGHDRYSDQTHDSPQHCEGEKRRGGGQTGEEGSRNNKEQIGESRDEEYS